MIDKIHEIFTSFEKRVKSPIFGSFALSWLLVNWRVVLSVFDKEILESYGCDTLVQMIEFQSYWRLVWLPLIVTALYLGLGPFLGNCMRAFDAWIRKWGYNWLVDISKEGSVSLARYLKHRESYDALSSSLSEIIKNESHNVKRVEELNGELATIFQEKQRLEVAAIEEMKIISLEFLNGYWDYTDGSVTKPVFINHRTFWHEQNSAKDKMNMFTLNDIHINIQSRSVAGVVYFPSINDQALDLNDYFKLVYSQDFNTVSGKIGKYKIKMARRN